MMKTLDDLKEHLDELFLFPLPNTVFFPHTQLHLNIFEPRYLEMVGDARRNGLPIAVVLIEPDSKTRSELPPLSPIATAGFIKASGDAPDGRMLIELQGLARIRINHELPAHRSFRRAKASIVEAGFDDVPQTEAMMRTLRSIVFGLQNRNPEFSTALWSIIHQTHDPVEVADQIADQIFSQPQSRQAHLAELDPHRRLTKIIDQLSSIMAQTATLTGALSMN